MTSSASWIATLITTEMIRCSSSRPSRVLSKNRTIGELGGHQLQPQLEVAG